MIVVKLMGGLGNQMFQYAAAKAVAVRQDTQLFLDTTWYEGRKALGDTSRPFELEAFKISGKKAPKKISRAAFVTEFPDNASTLRAKFLWGKLPHLTLVRQDGHRVNKKIIKAPNDSFIIGWCQSGDYFKDVPDAIRQDFRFATEPGQTISDWLKKIKDSTAVSVHVRRGDYVTNADANKQHGLTGLPYYKAAAKLISGKVKGPTFFVFSDDLDWCRKNLKLGANTHYVDQSGPDYEDLRLMSNCQHHIVANSSFSWWGAWLNSSKDKIVIAPKIWFHDRTVDDSDVAPKDWIRL